MEKYLDKYRIPSARLQGYDYSQEGKYFLTICTDQRQHFFGTISDGNMNLSDMGKWADACWQEIPKHFPNVDLGAYVIMPNHMHGIVMITDRRDVACNVSFRKERSPFFDEISETETLHATSLHATSLQKIAPKPRSIATIIRSYKSAVTRQIRSIHADFAWQSRYHDHIIRNEESFQRISEYIVNNPQSWDEDKFYN